MKLKIANKAIVASTAGAVIVRTHDLAREIGGQMIGMSYLASPPDATAILAPDWPGKADENG